MKIKTFDGKKLTIRKFSKRDLRNVRNFQDFFNSLIEENAKITMNKKLSLKEEKAWLEMILSRTKRHKSIALLAESNKNKMVVGTILIHLDRGRMSHIGRLGITIRKGYREMGLGSYLTQKIIKLAKKELRPKPKMIRLSVFSTNKPAIKLYKKYGFRKVAIIPKQLEFKGKLFDEVIMLKKI